MIETASLDCEANSAIMQVKAGMEAALKQLEPTGSETAEEETIEINEL